MVEYIGVLSIRLLAGVNLIACDIGGFFSFFLFLQTLEMKWNEMKWNDVVGKSDPFVVFNLGQQKAKSKVLIYLIWGEREREGREKKKGN